MGQNKAFLPWAGRTLLEHTAKAVEQAVGSVTLVGDPRIYGHLAYPVLGDHFIDSGPLGGIEAALSATTAEWNLIAACDTAGIGVGCLSELMAAAGEDYSVVCATGPDGRVHPLCGAWRRNCLSVVRRALKHGERRVLSVVETLRVRTVPAEIQNVNTPLEWSRFLESNPT